MIIFLWLLSCMKNIERSKTTPHLEKGVTMSKSKFGQRISQKFHRSRIKKDRIRMEKFEAACVSRVDRHRNVCFTFLPVAGSSPQSYKEGA